MTFINQSFHRKRPTPITCLPSQNKTVLRFAQRAVGWRCWERKKGTMSDNGVSFSFAGCGFLGIYQIGVASCLHQQVPHLLENAKFAGASAGAVIACCLMCDVPMGKNILSLFFHHDLFMYPIDLCSSVCFVGTIFSGPVRPHTSAG